MQTVLRAGQLFLNSYQTTRLLGSGGMGQAYLGTNIHTKAAVVIKVMHAHLAQDQLNRRRFAAEIDLLGRFRHPHAVALFDADAENDELPFLVQEFVPGTTLGELIRDDGALSVPRTARLAGQLCQVLHALHEQGILHRDISSANIMVAHPNSEGEQLKLMDFGFASLGASAGVYFALDKLAGPRDGIGGGTPDYLCPEQIRKEPVDRRGDLYSVGVLLFEMLTGALPFGDAQSVTEILHCQLHRSPPTCASRGIQDVPLRLETLIHRLLAKQPVERPASARQLAQEFGLAVGFEIAPDSAFQSGSLPQETLEVPCDDDLDILDRFDAWMPEQIAVMKLRGFLDQVDGEVLSSFPGKIRVRILDPRVKLVQQPGGFFKFLGLRRPALAQPRFLHLELRMEKRSRDGRNLVELSVVLEPSGPDTSDELAMRRGFAERICRELRAFLMA